MFTDLSPMWIPVAVFAGGIISPFLGWATAYRESGKAEKISWLKVASSAVIGVIAAFVFFGQYSSAVSVGIPDMELAFVAGFGADKILKNAGILIGS